MSRCSASPTRRLFEVLPCAMQRSSITRILMNPLLVRSLSRLNPAIHTSEGKRGTCSGDALPPLRVCAFTAGVCSWRYGLFTSHRFISLLSRATSYIDHRTISPEAIFHLYHRSTAPNDIAYSDHRNTTIRPHTLVTATPRQRSYTTRAHLHPTPPASKHGWPQEAMLQFPAWDLSLRQEVQIQP